MLVDLERAMAAVDRLDWRIAFDETGIWEAWFHPNWEADPRRVAIYLADDKPSANEVAAIAALKLIVEHAPTLIRLARAATAWRESLDAYDKWWRDMDASIEDGEKRWEIYETAKENIADALAALEGKPDATSSN